MENTQTSEQNPVGSVAPQAYFIGVHSIPCDSDTIDTRHCYGTDEEEVLRQMSDSFAADFINNLPAASVLQEHLDLRSFLKNLRLSDERAEEAVALIRDAAPEELGELSTYLKPEEIIRAYMRFNKDEQIEVTFYKAVRVATYSTVKPAQVNIIYYDVKNGMAIAREGEDLVGYYQVNHSDNPHPDDYEWDNGFDFEFITPDQAEAIRNAGFPEIVERFEKMGAVSEG